MSWRSASGDIKKKIFFSNSVLSSSFEKISPVLGFLNINIIIIVFFSCFLVYFASLYIPCGDYNTSTTHYRYTSRNVLLIIRLFRFLVTLYTSQLSLIYSWLFWRFKYRVSAWISLYYWVHLALDLEERRLNNIDSLITSLIIKIISLIY